jgi:hypothetical protein
MVLPNNTIFNKKKGWDNIAQLVVTKLPSHSVIIQLTYIVIVAYKLQIYLATRLLKYVWIVS